MTTTLTAKKCSACDSSTKPMPDPEEELYLDQVRGWTLKRDGTHRIEKGFELEDFMAAMGFANRIAQLAEAEGHHPDLHVGYGKLRVELSTHKVGGLTENDFILAAKIDDMKPS